MSVVANYPPGVIDGPAFHHPLAQLMRPPSCAAAWRNRYPWVAISAIRARTDSISSMDGVAAFAVFGALVRRAVFARFTGICSAPSTSESTSTVFFSSSYSHGDRENPSIERPGGDDGPGLGKGMTFEVCCGTLFPEKSYPEPAAQLNGYGHR